MDDGERLSAYLAGDLDADETAALEAALAGDPSLRARLERIRATGAALAALPDVSPSADFSARLRETLRQDIEQRTGSEAAPAVDELARRRLQRTAGSSRFVGLGVAAAALAVVVGVSASSLLGSDGEDVASTLADGVPESAAGMTQDAGDPLAPFVRVTDTDHDAESVAALAQDERLLAIPEEVGQDEARHLESDRYAAFGLEAAPPAALSAEGQGGGTTAASSGSDGGTDSEPVPPDADFHDQAADQDDGQEARRELGTQAADPFTDVRRCLTEIVATANQPVIPLFAEVAAYEGEPAIVYLVLTRQPDARTFNRIEVWVVSRADCFPLNLQQVER